MYAYKVVLSMSIIAMVNHTKPADTHITECSTNTTHEEQYFPGPKYNWDDDMKSQVLSSFFYGYVITQIPAGICASKYGGKWIYGISILIAGILSILGPIAAKIDHRLFIATRVGQGLSEGVVFPSMNAMIAQWMPKNERSRGTTIIYTGATIGTVVTLPVTAILSKNEFMGSWQATFYLLGIAGIVWFILWIFLVYESPELHPFISEKEKMFILENDGGLKVKDKFSVPYKEILTSCPVYALILTHFGQNWGFLTVSQPINRCTDIDIFNSFQVLNLMPSYMSSVLNMDINQVNG